METVDWSVENVHMDSGYKPACVWTLTSARSGREVPISMDAMRGHFARICRAPTDADAFQVFFSLCFSNLNIFFEFFN